MSGNLTLVQNGASGQPWSSNATSIEYRPVGITSTWQHYQMYNVTTNMPMWQHQGYGSSGPYYDIERELATDQWADKSGQDFPSHFIVTSTTNQPTGQLSGALYQATSTNKYLHLFKGTSSNDYIGYVDVWTPFHSSSGGNNAGPLSGNDLIENVYFAKNSDSSIALGFDWENISSYKVWVNRGGTTTSHELFLTGTSGSIAGYTGAGANALTNLSEGDTVWLTKGNGDYTIVDGLGSISNPYVHKVVVWSKDSEKVYAKCFGDVTFSAGQSSAGTKATRLRGGKSYGSYQSPTTNEITHELPRGLGKYQIELWNTSNGTPTTFVDYGAFFS